MRLVLLVSTCCSAALFGCGDSQPKGSTHALSDATEPGGEGSVGNQHRPERSDLDLSTKDELNRFTEAAKLSDAERTRVEHHLRRFERNYAVLRDGDPLLAERLSAHVRTLILAQLNETQAASFDGSRLPGSRAFKPLLADNADENSRRVAR